MTLESDKIDLQQEFPDHHFRTEIPNFLFEAGLSVYEMSLYLFIKFRAGDYKKCYQSIGKIAEILGMSKRQAQNCLKSLEIGKNKFNLPLIRKTAQKKENGASMPTIITIINVWGYNGKFYNQKKIEGDAPYARGGVHHMHGEGAPYAPKQEPLEQEPYLKKVNGRDPVTWQKSEKKLIGNEKFKLNETQAQAYDFLVGLNLKDTKETRLTWWAKTYSIGRLYQVYQESVKFKAKNTGAYMSKLLKEEAVVSTGRVEENERFAKDFKQSNGWNSLKINKKYASFPLRGGMVEMDFNTDTFSFISLISEKFRSYNRK